MGAMSESDGTKAPARPRQVTVAGVTAAAACLLLVVSLFDSMATVRSADMRGRVAKFLATPPGDGLGMSTDTVIDLLRAVVLVSGGLAAAGVVLAIFALQRHRGARVGLGVVGLLMLFSATFVSGILPLAVAVAAAMLWGREARDWYDGRQPRPVPAPSAPAEPPPHPSAGPPAGSTYPQAGSDPAAGPGPQVGSPWSSPPQPPGGPVPGYPAPGTFQARPASRTGRPVQVTAAVWLTWVFSAFVAFLFLLVVLTILLDRDRLLEEIQRTPTLTGAGFTTRQILGFMWVLSAVSIVWSLGAIALAVLVFRRVEVARVTLVVSAVVAGLVCLAAVPVGWPGAVAAFTTVTLLSRRSTRDWFAGRGLPSGTPQQQLPQPPPRSKPPVW
jgi:hypothetical protein